MPAGDIIVRRALPSESFTMAQVRLAAFDGTPLMKWLGRDISALSRMQRDAILQGNKLHFVAVDRSVHGTAAADTVDGKLIGLAIFCRVSDDQSKLYQRQIGYLQWIEAQAASLETYVATWVKYLQDRKSVSEQLRKIGILGATLSAGKQTALMDKGIHDFIDLSILTIHPSYQGKGVGKKLLEVVFEHARREDVPVWLESTPAGYPVYIKVGFKETGCTMTIQDGDQVIEQVPGLLWRP
jgi:GNAT superfamily N-acetyltransferase